MSTAADKQDRQARILAELSELGLALARDLQARALAATEIAEASELGLAFQRVSRSVRQTLALEAKLDRDRARAAREDRDADQAARTTHAERRKSQVRIAVRRCVRYAHSGIDAETLVDDLEERLDEDELRDVFAGSDDIDLHIARLCAELEVPEPWADEAREAAARATSTGSATVHPAIRPPDPGANPGPDPGAPSPPDWRSSA